MFTIQTYKNLRQGLLNLNRTVNFVRYNDKMLYLSGTRETSEITLTMLNRHYCGAGGIKTTSIPGPSR